MIPIFYRLLLGFYPPEFRDRFGEELIETASEVDRGPARRRWRAMQDVFWTVVAARSEVRHERMTIGVQGGTIA